MRNLLLVLLSLVIALVVFSGCAAPAATTKAPGPTTAAPAPASTTAPPATAPAPTTPAAAAPKYGGTLSFPITIYPAGFDPHLKPSYGPFVTIPVFNNIVRYDPTKADTTPNNIIPDLASKWTTSADGKTWTFTLRNDVKWHDGHPFNADDVVYTFEKLKDAKRSGMASYFTIMSSVAKVDDFTVQLNLTGPTPSLLTQLCSPYCAVEAKSSAGLDARTTQFLLGTGPFKYKDSTTGTSITLVKNPDYFRKGAPYLDAISMYVVTDTRGQIDAMAAKRLDMVNPLGFSIPSQEDFNNYNANVKDAVFNMRQTQVGNIIWINTAHKPFDDVRVRQALALTFDRPSVYTAVYGDPRWNGTNAGFFTNFYGLSPAEVAKTVGWDLPADQRLAKAKSLLAAAGYPSGGFKLNMVSISSMPVFAKQFELLADMWKRQLNIDTQLTPYVLADALNARNAGNYDLFVYASLSLMGDPDELMPLFKGDSSANYTGYKNPAADALWTQQSSEMDLNKRVQETRQIETILLTDLPAIPACFSNYGVAWWPYVKGFVIQASSYTSNLAFETVWLDK